eukprot:2210067-Amphidinium_carterae.1
MQTGGLWCSSAGKPMRYHREVDEAKMVLLQCEVSLQAARSKAPPLFHPCLLDELRKYLRIAVPTEVNEIVASAASAAGVPVMLDIGGACDPRQNELIRTTSDFH